MTIWCRGSGYRKYEAMMIENQLTLQFEQGVDLQGSKSSKADAKLFSKYVVYVDESGDHGLKNIDPNYPVFVLAFF